MGVNVTISVPNIYLNVLNILHNVKNLNSPTFFLQKIYILFILRRIFLWDSHSYELWQHFVTMPEWKLEMLSTFESNFLKHFLQTSHFKSYHAVRFITVVSKAKDPDACQFNTRRSNERRNKVYDLLFISNASFYLLAFKYRTDFTFSKSSQVQTLKLSQKWKIINRWTPSDIPQSD